MGADSSDGGAKIRLSGYYKWQNLWKYGVSPSDEGLACSAGGYTPLVLPWHHPWFKMNAKRYFFVYVLGCVNATPLYASHEAGFQRMSAIRWMGVAATPKCKENAYWTNKEREKSGGFDHEFSHHHALFASHNVTNTLYNIIKTESFRISYRQYLQFF